MPRLEIPSVLGAETVSQPDGRISASFRLGDGKILWINGQEGVGASATGMDVQLLQQRFVERYPTVDPWWTS